MSATKGANSCGWNVAEGKCHFDQGTTVTKPLYERSARFFAEIPYIPGFVKKFEAIILGASRNHRLRKFEVPIRANSN